MAAAFVFSLVIGFGGSISVLAAGPAPVDLLSAGNFTVLSKSGITDTGCCRNCRGQSDLGRGYSRNVPRSNGDNILG